MYDIVPQFGVSRPYVLDMLPGHSMTEFLVQCGTLCTCWTYATFSAPHCFSLIDRAIIG
ncbi:MAG TPA: hypothetical protein VIH59_11815 [Candidatus Tectomicrobia bacterium]|jgi:hypothetical protein